MTDVDKNLDIGRVTYSLYCTKDEGIDAFALLYRVTTDWDHEYATWEKATQNTDWDSAGGDYSEEMIDSVEIPSASAGLWQDFIVTSVVKDFLNDPESNLGFHVKMSVAMTGINYASSEYEDETKRPKLKIMHGDGDYEAPEVTIKSPAGGEVFYIGTKETVTWDATDNEGVVGSIVLFRPNSWTAYSVLDSLDGNPGEYEWTIPEGDFNDCNIKVIAYDKVGNIGKDECDESFKIEEMNAIIPNMINTSLKTNYSVSIINVQGRVIADYNTTNLRGIDRYTASLPAGVHIISIKTPDNRIIKKYGLLR